MRPARSRRAGGLRRPGSGAPDWGRRPVRMVHWIMSLLVVAAFGAGAAWMLIPGEASRLRENNEALARQRFELQRTIERLVGQDRVAEVHVIDQVLQGQLVNGQPAPADATTIEFIELDRQQRPLPARRFVLQDRVIHLDALVIKFEQGSVAAGDTLRGKSLALFRRVYGEHQDPSEGYAVDPQGDVPNIYRLEPEPSEFERTLWTRFWDYATNPDLAEADGVRVAQGEVVYVPMNKGQGWTITLQHNGGLSIKLHKPGGNQTCKWPTKSAN